MAYKQGFRWKPAGYAIAPPPTDAAPVSVWANPKPVFPIIPVDSIIPTGNGLGSTWLTGTTASPFALGPVPPLQSHIPNPKHRYSKGARPSRSKSRPARSTPSTTSTTTVAPAGPSVPALVLAPVTVRGVPGSTIVGIDTVSAEQHFESFSKQPNSNNLYNFSFRPWFLDLNWLKWMIQLDILIIGC